MWTLSKVFSGSCPLPLSNLHPTHQIVLSYQGLSELLASASVVPVKKHLSLGEKGQLLELEKNVQAKLGVRGEFWKAYKLFLLFLSHFTHTVVIAQFKSKKTN